MTPAQHATNTGALGRPADTTHEQVVGLPITRLKYSDGLHAVRSYWRPSEAERQAITAGALVYLEVWGRTHAPLFVGVDGVPAL